MGGSTHDRVLRIEERLRERKQRRRRRVNAWLGIVCVLCVCCVSWILCTEQTPGVSMCMADTARCFCGTAPVRMSLLGLRRLRWA